MQWKLSVMKVVNKYFFVVHLLYQRTFLCFLWLLGSMSLFAPPCTLLHSLLLSQAVEQEPESLPNTLDSGWVQPLGCPGLSWGGAEEGYRMFKLTTEAPRGWLQLGSFLDQSSFPSLALCASTLPPPNNY